MKKIAITTSVSISNYGTKLQALAMCRIFEERGFQPLVLEYSEALPQKWIVQLKNYLGKIVKPILFGKNYLYVAKFNREYHNNDQFFLNNIISRYKAIDADDCMIPHYKIIGSRIKLQNYARQFDAAVTGSDQVWHPVLNKSNLWFFTLNFVNNSIRKIAYAPSLGVDVLTPEQAILFKKLLINLDYISLREKSGVDSIQSLTDKNVSLVLDPTLLVGRKLWDKLYSECKVPKNVNYCLCYLLGTNSEHRRICEVVASKLGLKIYNFSHFKAYNEADDKLSGEKLFDVSPMEFIGLVKNAKFVITDSFHCSVFSMMYHVPFMTLLRFQNNDSLSTNTRIFSMLSQFGLDNRILSSDKDIDIIVNSSIDFDRVEECLAAKRKISNSFLDQALGDEKIEI